MSKKPTPAVPQYIPIGDVQTKAVLLKADELLERVAQNLRSGVAIKITNEEYFKLQTEIRSTDQFPMIGEWHKLCIENYLKKISNQLEGRTKLDDEDYIRLISKHYYDFQILAMWIQKFLMSHETFYFKATRQTTCFRESFVLFREQYFKALKDQLISIVFKFVTKARQDLEIPKEELKRLVQIYDDQDFGSDIRIEEDRQSHKLRVISDSTSNKDSKNYELLFESPYVEEIKKYFMQKNAQWTNKSTPEFVQEALFSIGRERELCLEYYPRSEEVINNAINNVIIKDQSEKLLDHPTGIENMLKNNKDQEIVDIYKLLSRVKESLAQLGQRIRLYYQNCLQQIGKDTKEKIANFKPDKTKNLRDFQRESSIEWVKAIIDKKTFVDNQVVNLFQNDLEIQKARDNAFQIALRDFKEAPIFFSMYCDDLMKQQLNDQESIERQIEISAIFDYLNTTRDEFLQFYQKALCRRLIGFQSKSMTTEKQIVTRFKNSVGALATLNRLQNMLQDIEQNDTYNRENTQFSDVLKIYVLNSVAWPLKRTEMEKCIFPTSFAETVKQYNHKYSQTYKQRKINWLFNEGSAEINFQSSNKKMFQGKYVLKTSTYQMLILLRLNDRASYSVTDLIEETGISKESFDNNLKQLIKLKILTCDDGENYSDYSKIQVNLTFDCPKKVIPCLPRPTMQVSKEDQEEVAKRLEQERTYIIKAYIVRIMKGRKTMLHNDLIKDAIELIKTCARTFEPKIPQIKKCIDSLVEEDYIKRTEEDKNKYEYIP